jgi:hypothetical protein
LPVWYIPLMIRSSAKLARHERANHWSRFIRTTPSRAQEIPTQTRTSAIKWPGLIK